MPRFETRVLSLTLPLLVAQPLLAQRADEHAAHARAAATRSTASAVSFGQGSDLPAGAADAEARLKSSPRHGEWVTVKTSPSDSVIAWVVYPERRTKAPVVIVIHEIFGLSTWIRAVADQLAADGFIAIAPDLLTMKRTGDLTSEWQRDSAVAAIRTLKREDVQRDLDAVAAHGMSLPAAEKKYGVVGFCWGGSTSFAHAVHAPGLGASVVYYGSSPEAAELASVKAPVLGLYGGEDARVNSTIPRADSALKALGRTYEHHEFAGAGHGFLRQQDGQNGANMQATREAWPKTVGWFKKHLGS
jgi:carboxymethylenebutenolidase